MAVNARRSLFATHRGRLVKRATGVALILAVAMMFASNASKGDTKEVRDDPSTLTAEERKDLGITPNEVKVAAAPANPFRPYEGVNIEAEAISGDGSSEDWASEDSEEEPEDTNEYTALLTTAQDVATACGTYTYQRTADEWVSSIPSLDEEFRPELLATATRNWSRLEKMQVVSTAQLVGTSPDIVYYRDAAGLAQISVTVAQKVSSVRGESTKTRSYVLTLKRSDEGGDSWLVTGMGS